MIVYLRRKKNVFQLYLVEREIKNNLDILKTKKDEKKPEQLLFCTRQNYEHLNI